MPWIRRFSDLSRRAGGAIASVLLIGTMVTGGGIAKARPAPTYEWLATPSAPKEAPIYVVDSHLRLADGGEHYVPRYQVVSQGWGETGTLELVGAERKALPQEVSLTWFSFTEDRFYKGTFALPVETMEALFKTTALVRPSGETKGYDKIIFGMAPGGHVSVWLSAGPTVKEIATFQAAEADLPWTLVLDNPDITRAAYTKRVLTDHKITAPMNPAQLRARYADAGQRSAWAAWVPQLAGAARAGATLWYKGLNGEHDWIDLGEQPRADRPLPKSLSIPVALTLGWNDPVAGHLSAEITLDPDATRAAFASFAAANDPSPLTLTLEPSSNAETVAVALRRGAQAIRLKASAQVYGTGD